MKVKTKIMHHRLEALKLAEELGNVSRVFRVQSFEACERLPPIHKTYAQTTPYEVENHILDLVVQHLQKGYGLNEATLETGRQKLLQANHLENRGTLWAGKPLSAASRFENRISPVEYLLSLPQRGSFNRPSYEGE